MQPSQVDIKLKSKMSNCWNMSFCYRTGSHIIKIRTTYTADLTHYQGASVLRMIHQEEMAWDETNFIDSKMEVSVFSESWTNWYLYKFTKCSSEYPDQKWKTITVSTYPVEGLCSPSTQSDQSMSSSLSSQTVSTRKQTNSERASGAGSWPICCTVRPSSLDNQTLQLPTRDGHTRQAPEPSFLSCSLKLCLNILAWKVIEFWQGGRRLTCLP